MRVLRRRAAAMTPRLKYFALLFTLSLFLFALIYIPTFIYITLIVIVTYSVAHAASVPASLGRNLQAGLSIGAAFRHWLRGQRVTDVSASARSRARSRGVHPELQSEGHLRPRLADPGANYREALPSESLLFSPRDFLMGSYIGKAESPTADVGRPRVVRNPREQLRERLARPNHAVVTPNRRLSFAGETPGAMGRFTIAPQRHYPVQQSGTPAVGVLPPVKWDSFKKKCVLSPRNSQSPRGHISVRIARPEQKIPSFEQLSSPGFPGTAVDPCSRESVLKVLKESRKRQVEVDDEGEDRSFMAEQKRKRTRNESGGSAQSAFEPRLPNGTPSQLVPKPGSLKRGATLGAEESITKRSRTSSISSVSGVHAHRTSASTSRNAIFSSYSSSKGFFQKPSAPSSPMSTPGSSRCQTPEGVAKRPREENFPSPSLSSTVRAEKTAAEKPPATSKVTPATPKIPITTTPDSTGSGGKRKRKIQLVSVNRDDPIYMPPPPELGYKVTAKDLDDEKKAAFSKIQKILEEAVPEPEKSVASSGAAAAPSITAPSSTLTLSSLLAAPLPTTTKAAIPVINLDPSPSNSSATAPAAPNPLLEALKMKSSTSATSTSAALTSTVTSIKPPISTNPPVSSAAPQLSTASQSSAFTQVLAQFSKPPSSTTNTEGQSLLGLSSAATSSLPSLAQTPPAASSSGSVGTTLPTSGFKPIFSVATTSSTSTPESKAIQSIKPIFPSSTPAAGFSSSPASIATSNPPTAVSSNSSSIFGLATSNSTTVPSLFPPMTTPATSTPTNNSTTTTDAAPAKSLFGNFAASTTTNSVLPQAPSGGSSFQFGAAAPVTTSSNSTFSFGVSQPQQPKLEAPAATTLKFGASAAAAAPTAPGTTASSNTTFSFGVTPPPKAEAPSAGSTFQFGASTAAPAATSSTTTNNTFTFGASQPLKTEVPAAGSTFQFGAVAPSAAGAAPAATTAAPSNSTFGFGVKQPEQPPAPTQNAFAFGQTAPSQNSNTSSFGGFGMTGTAATSAPPTTATNSNSTFTFGATKQEQPQASAQSVFGFGQSLTNTTTASFGAFGMSNAAATTTTAAATANTQTPFAFGKSSFEAPAAQPSFNSVAAAPQPFAFGASSAPANNTAPTPFNFGAPAASTAPSFGTPSKPAFGSSSNVFAFGSNTAPSAAPSFAAAPAQTQSSSSGTFAFGAAAPPPGPAAQQPSTGFNFGASMPVSQFGSPVVNNATPQMGGFNFGAADKPAFGASTPAFGHNAAAAPSPFGTPGTPVQGFSPAPFGSAGTPSFSIGTGSKPAGTRQRLQARRQHNRKK